MATKRTDETLNQAERGNGAAMGGITYDRPTRTYWNRYGEPAELPGDAAQFQILVEQGWLPYPPQQPATKPRFQVMRDGSHFQFDGASQDVSAAERARMSTSPDLRDAQAMSPTATYYTKEGTALEDLPADPESLAKYLAAGLSLNPPDKAPSAPKASRAKVQLLREA